MRNERQGARPETNRTKSTTDGRCRVYTYEELIARDKGSLDIFWLRDESLSDSDNLPAPEVIALEIVEDLEAALGWGFIVQPKWMLSTLLQ